MIPNYRGELAKSTSKQASRRRWQRPRKALRITLGGRRLHFKSPDDFSFAIECRTSVPAVRFSELMERSPEYLWRESDRVKSVEKTLVSILEDALCDTRACGPAMRDLSLQIFSNDHQWRLIVETLNELNDDYETYKRLALIKYMQYLGERQALLRLVYAIKNTGAAHEHAVPARRDDGTPTTETILFDVAQAVIGTPATQSLRRLPQGEAVRLHTLPGHPVAIRLGKHTFELRNESGWVLCDPQGHQFALPDRQITIGRSSDNDIILGSEFRNVSRRHLIIEPLDDQVVVLTDISSHGTFTPPLHTQCSGR